MTTEAQRAAFRAKNKAWREANPEKVVEYNRRTRERRWAASGMPADVEGPCQCCGRGEPNGRWGWHRDHDHETGAFRGILCHSCNVGIGQLGDTLEGVEAAARYLRNTDPPPGVNPHRGAT